MRIFYLEDHSFFAEEIIEYLTDDLGHEVVFIDNWKDAEKLLSSGESFDVSILDVILKNGKTGVQAAEQWESQLGRILFITGCIDEVTINAVNKYASVSKLTTVWNPLNEFLNGSNPKI